VLLDDLDADSDHLHGLVERNRPGELTRSGAEDIGCDLWSLVLTTVGVPEPLDEGGDAGLGDKSHPGAVLCSHPAIPRQLLVHPGDHGRCEHARCPFKPLDRRHPHSRTAGRHIGLTG
jgi:hypothetical protein